jgi:hypothetical protein
MIVGMMQNENLKKNDSECFEINKAHCCITILKTPSCISKKQMPKFLQDFENRLIYFILNSKCIRWMISCCPKHTIYLLHIHFSYLSKIHSILKNSALYSVSSQNQTHKFKNEKLFEKSTLNIDLSYLVITFQIIHAP